MNPLTLTLILTAWMPISLALQQQLASWSPQQDVQQQFAPQRQPIAADLQNQVNALSAQLAAANRQLQYFHQQLSLVGQQQQQQPQLHAEQLAAPQQQQVAAQEQQQQQHHHHHHQHHHQQQQQQLAAQQFYANQPNQQQQPLVSTLLDEGISDPRSVGQRLYQQSQQAQPQAQFDSQSGARAQLEQPNMQQQTSPYQNQGQPAATSTTVGPPSIEPSLEVQEPQQQQQQAPANHAPPHNPPKNDDKFSIGLGVLSPGYTQKFGNTALDFNQDKNGFSFTLSNNGHNNQPQEPAKAPQANQQNSP